MFVSLHNQNIIKKSIVIAVLLACHFFVINAQEDTAVFGEEGAKKAKCSFCFNLMETGYGSLFHLGLMKYRKDGKTEIEFLTLNDFLLQASGRLSSCANPDTINFFDKYKIKNPYTTTSSLWKLRFAKSPWQGSEEAGWASYSDSSYFLLSAAQKAVLSKYGMKRLTDYISGDNVFKLLRNMEDSTWINQYKAGNAAGPN